MSTEYATTDDIRAWDTEYGDYVAWGTHSPSLARSAVRKYILEVIGEDPENLDEMTPPFEDFEKATRYWADPKAVEVEGMWDSSMFARHEDGYIPYDGWVPYMVVTL
jgi:hypothetical protein